GRPRIETRQPTPHRLAIGMFQPHALDHADLPIVFPALYTNLAELAMHVPAQSNRGHSYLRRVGTQGRTTPSLTRRGSVSSHYKASPRIRAIPKDTASSNSLGTPSH